MITSTRKPGGNYTQPYYDPLTEEYEHIVYVNWIEVARCKDSVEAHFKLIEKMGEK